MAFFTFYIVNKAGGLIFNKDLSPVAKLPTNDYLTNASKFHALHAIAKQLAPVLSGGITSIDAPTFSLYCLETLTGLKLFLTARPKMESTAQAFLGRAYEAYAEYALKVSRDPSRRLGECLQSHSALLPEARPIPQRTCSPRLTDRCHPNLHRFFLPTHLCLLNFRLQNPFYEADMPIRIKFFDVALERALRELGMAAAGGAGAGAGGI